MTPKRLKMLRAKVTEAIPTFANEYAEIITICSETQTAMIEVECVLALIGHTPATFMISWAEGDFDA